MGWSAVAVTGERHGWRGGEKKVAGDGVQPRKSLSDGGRNALRFENHEAWGSRFWGNVYGDENLGQPPHDYEHYREAWGLLSKSRTELNTRHH